MPHDEIELDNRTPMPKSPAFFQLSEAESKTTDQAWRDAKAIYDEYERLYGLMFEVESAQEDKDRADILNTILEREMFRRKENKQEQLPNNMTVIQFSNRYLSGSELHQLQKQFIALIEKAIAGGSAEAKSFKELHGKDFPSESHQFGSRWTEYVAKLDATPSSKCSMS